MEKEKLIENDFSFKEKKTDYFKKSNICSKLFYFWAYKILKVALSLFRSQIRQN